MIQTFYLDAATGQRLQSPDYAVAATDTPTGKLMSVEPLRIQYLSVVGQKGTPVAAPSSTIKFGLKQGTVALGNYSDTTFDVYTDAFTAPADPTLPGAFYTATLTIDSTALRALFPVATNGTSPGTVPLIGEILSGTVPSSTFAFIAQNNLIKGTESPAVAIPGPSGYPTPTALAASIAAATLDTSAAPLQPFSAYLAYGNRLARISGGYSGITLDLNGLGLTYADPAEIVAWLTEAVYFIQPNLGSAPLAIDLSNNALTNSEDILDAIAAALTSAPFTSFGGGFTVYLQGGTNAAPTTIAHEDATLVLQLPSPVPAHAGTLVSGSDTSYGDVVTIIYDSGLAFSASNVDISGPVYTVTIGVSDSPSMSDVVSFLNTCAGGGLPAPLNFYSPPTFDASGAFNGSDAMESDYPLVFTGSAVVGCNPGVVATPNASIATIQAYNGSTPTTN